MKSIDLVNDAFGKDTSISINVAAKQAGDVEFMTSFAHALEATGCPTALHHRGHRGRVPREGAFPDRDPADAARARRRHLDRRFRRRLFLAVGARRHHRRRDQDRPLLHHGHPQAPAQPGHFARDRVARRSARHDRDRRGRGVASRSSPTCRPRPRSATRRAIISPSRSSSTSLQPSASHVVHEARPEDFGRQRIAARGGR